MRYLAFVLTLLFTGHIAARPTAKQLAAEVDKFAARAMTNGVSSALGVSIVMDGKIVYERAFGMADATARIPATTNSLWYVASTSKSFTGMAVSLLANDGVIDIHAPITTLLPNARWHPDVKAQELTLADFLTLEAYPLLP